MVRYRDMLVETPYSLADVETRTIKSGHERENQCTYCGTEPDDPWYPINEITVYRVWTSRSVYDPDRETALEQGGVWQWRCEDHPKRAWAPFSHTAPEELQPLEEHPCDEILPLGKSKCRRKDSTQMFVEGWFCPDHKAKYVNAANERRLLGGEDLEAGESA